MKTFKRTLSLVLAVCLLASMAVIATVTSSAVEGTETIAKTAPRTDKITYPQRDKDKEGNVFEVKDDKGNVIMLNGTQDHGARPVVTEIVGSDPDIDVKTRTYRFYMPDSWRNDRNDNYDGKSLDSCCAGVYLWGCSYSSEDYMGECEQGWPGYRVLERDPKCPNVFVCDVPEDAYYVIFNNTVDAGTSHTNPNYGLNFQTDDIPTNYFDPEEQDLYGFYKEPIESFDGMILVPNQRDSKINEHSGATAFGAEWFYYYGNGKYGIYETLAEAEAAGGVCQNGEFPSSLKISDPQIRNYLNNDPTYTVYCSADPSELKVYSEDESLVSVSPITAAVKPPTPLYKSQVTVKGLAAGSTSVVFEQRTVGEGDNEQLAIRRCKVVNGYQRPSVSVSNKSVNIGKTVKLNPSVKYATSVSYKSSNTKVATVDSKGTVKGVAAGTAKITVTVKAGSYNVTATATVTVKKLTNPMTVKAKAVKASAKKNTTLAASKYATVSKAKGKVTYKKAKGDGKITVASGGTMTVKKGLKKGTYTVQVKVTAAGDKTYDSSVKTIAVKVSVK